MATNEILPFASTNTGTNLLTQSEYAADSQRVIGHQPGIARSKLENKALRQSSLIAAGIAEFLADNQSNNITDSLTPQNVADYMAAVVRSLGIPTLVSGGSSDVIVGFGYPPNVALTNGTTVVMRAFAANTTTTPTFALDGLTAAKTIVKGNNLALVAGDIAGAGHWLEMNFDSALDKWVLQNPAYPVGTVTTSNDPTFADNSAKPASTSWMRGAMAAIATAAGFSYSFGKIGHIKFPSWLMGWIFQWGEVSVTTAATVNFPVAFPNALFKVFTNGILNAGETPSAPDTLTGYENGSGTLSNFVLRCGHASVRLCSWFAIGY